jgi:hypothetical protein
MLAQINQPALSIIVGAFVVTWILLLAVWLKQSKESAAMREALKGSSGERLEPLLTEHLRSKGRLETSYQEAVDRIGEIEAWCRDAVAHTGFVRYDAFGDSGGHQSFALALQNEQGDGIVLTSIVGRDQIRIYGKSISGGKCEQGLTPEEQEALKLATKGRS